LPKGARHKIGQHVLGVGHKNVIIEYVIAKDVSTSGLLNQLALEPWLSCACDNERIREADLDKWLDKVKVIDEKKHREQQQQS
jgi:hypothetical protein